MPTHNIKIISARRSYSIGEAANLLGINRKTCERWVKYEGLRVVAENTSPLLITGGDLIDFIKKKREERKIPVKENEFLCLKCQKAVRAKVESEQTIETGKKIGKNNQKQLKKIGICEHCNTQLNKFLRVSQQD